MLELPLLALLLVALLIIIDIGIVVHVEIDRNLILIIHEAVLVVEVEVLKVILVVIVRRLSTASIVIVTTKVQLDALIHVDTAIFVIAHHVFHVKITEAFVIATVTLDIRSALDKRLPDFILAALVITVCLLVLLSLLVRLLRFACFLEVCVEEDLVDAHVIDLLTPEQL
ncbi:hypothetical protein HBH78_080880 [Parastagonospora nodorum]|nr:hypothetical protein HBH78_080880 [Parastagonospora nodorum]